MNSTRNLAQQLSSVAFTRQDIDACIELLANTSSSYSASVLSHALRTCIDTPSLAYQILYVIDRLQEKDSTFFHEHKQDLIHAVELRCDSESSDALQLATQARLLFNLIQADEDDLRLFPLTLLKHESDELLLYWFWNHEDPSSALQRTSFEIEDFGPEAEQLWKNILSTEFSTKARQEYLLRWSKRDLLDGYHLTVLNTKKLTIPEVDLELHAIACRSITISQQFDTAQFRTLIQSGIYVTEQQVAEDLHEKYGDFSLYFRTRESFTHPAILKSALQNTPTLKLLLDSEVSLTEEDVCKVLFPEIRSQLTSRI